MKERIALALLGGASLVCAGAIAIELLPEPAVPPPPTAATKPAGEPAPAPAHREEVDPDDLVETLIERPPFSPLRRPERSAAPTESGLRPAGVPRLAGIMTSGTEKLAIFQVAGDDRQRVVREGADVAGWHVQQISAAEVVIEGPDGEQTVAPQLDPNAKPGEPAMPPRLGPGPPPVAAAAAAPPPTPNGLHLPSPDPRRGVPPVNPAVAPNRPGGPAPPRPLPSNVPGDKH